MRQRMGAISIEQLDTVKWWGTNAYSYTSRAYNDTLVTAAISSLPTSMSVHLHTHHQSRQRALANFTVRKRWDGEELFGLGRSNDRVCRVG